MFNLKDYLYNWLRANSTQSNSGSFNSTTNTYQYYNSNSEQSFDSQLKKAQDVSVDAVLASLYFNSIIFVLLMIMYESLRRTLPTVYSSRKRKEQNRRAAAAYQHPQSPPQKDRNADHSNNSTAYIPEEDLDRGTGSNDSGDKNLSKHPPQAHTPEGLQNLPDDTPLDWVAPVTGVPWSKVRKVAGLDGYFFLRYIRMCVRITAVSTVWFFLILVPIYVTAGNHENVTGWYHLSAQNIDTDSWRMWAPVVFCYLFSFFTAFVMKQEYQHFLELRQDFLARGRKDVNPQHQYSLMIENIPKELRSNHALAEYFENLFPGRVHSASVALNLPDLQEASQKCLRTCRRLEKSIAYEHAKQGKRPTHIVGRGRLNILGIDLSPCEVNSTCTRSFQNNVRTDNSNTATANAAGNTSAIPEVEWHEWQRPAKGTRVDSINYYTQELAHQSRVLFKLQKRKVHIANSGNATITADHWFDRMCGEANAVADTIMIESEEDNDLLNPNDSFRSLPGFTPQKRGSGIRWGSISPRAHYGSFGSSPSRKEKKLEDQNSRETRLVTEDHLVHQSSQTLGKESSITETSEQEQEAQQNHEESILFRHPFSRELYKGPFRRWAGRLGLDFLIYFTRYVNRQMDHALAGVIGNNMSSTGFVTFLDLSSTTCAVSTPLTVKPNVLYKQVAPEPRDIVWQNCHVSRKVQEGRKQVVGVFLFLGVLVWSFPLAAIQAFAKADALANIPAFAWILEFHGGYFMTFINGYLPVIALLGLICILPVIFEFIALRYERRKTYSEIQSSMMERYFTFQLANVYITVTAGSLWKALADILDHPMGALQLLGGALPTMVGYFVALLVTKMMAGLPMIFLRFGALSRMLLYRTLSNEHSLTQRELDAVYRLENVQYGWEFPTQLLVVVIVFTYAIICPVILPVGMLYFCGALLVYKKQVLYVYSPVYESGGALFPLAVQRTLVGLVCGQLTLLGYIVVRGCFWQPLFLFPLVFMTISIIRHFKRTYAEPSKHLSLERARDFDRKFASRADSMTNSGASGSGNLSVVGEGLTSFESSSSQFSSVRSSVNTDIGVEKRRSQFIEHCYRQPVLTELPAEPNTYRRGVEDPETMEVRRHLRHINRYASCGELSDPAVAAPLPTGEIT